MKKKDVFLKGLSIFLLIEAVILLIFSITYQEKSVEIKNITDVNISDLNDYATIYFDELDVLERYAFLTVDEYKDSEGIYTDITYYVYDDSQPMDKHELDCQYYIVRFRDKSGNEYITSMSISADKDVSSLINCPQTIPVCAGAAIITDNDDWNSTNKKLRDLRESALNEYSQKTQISRANITLGYQSKSIEQYQNDFDKGIASGKRATAIFGIAFAAVGVLLTLNIKRRKKLQ